LEQAIGRRGGVTKHLKRKKKEKSPTIGSSENKKTYKSYPMPTKHLLF
jgi:hypothetical protein